jgi:hypothetical protein
MVLVCGNGEIWNFWGKMNKVYQRSGMFQQDRKLAVWQLPDAGPVRKPCGD